MTPSQFSLLKWFAGHGGKGRLVGYSVVCSDGWQSATTSLVTWMHLTGEGAIAGSQGELHITDHGRRLLEGSDVRELPL